MRKITCIERVYKIEDDNTEYCVRIKKPLSPELTNKLLDTDTKVKTLLDEELVIENIKEKEKEKIKENENVIRIKKLIDDFHKNGKDFRLKDIVENTQISKGKIRYIMSVLHKEKYIERINPHENPRKARWRKVTKIIKIPSKTIKRLKLPIKKHSRESENTIKAKKFIDNKSKENKDFTVEELSNGTGINVNTAKHIIQRLKKDYVKRSNPEDKKGKYRYKKVEK